MSVSVCISVKFVFLAFGHVKEVSHYPIFPNPNPNLNPKHKTKEQYQSRVLFTIRIQLTLLQSQNHYTIFCVSLSLCRFHYFSFYRHKLSVLLDSQLLSSRTGHSLSAARKTHQWRSGYLQALSEELHQCQNSVHYFSIPEYVDLSDRVSSGRRTLLRFQRIISNFLCKY